MNSAWQNASMSTLERIQEEVRQLDAQKQEQVLAFVAWVGTQSADPVPVSEDEADLEWARFENQAAEASV